jgi:Ca-activated chloride channel family protein
MMEQVTLALAQFHWLRPWWLGALLPVLLMALLLWRQKRAARQWQALVAPNLLPFLLDGKSVRQSPWQIWLLALAWTLATLALAGPSWEKRPLPVHKNENALVLILDLSPSMLSEDIKPSRLVRARLKIADILRERRDGLTALVVYSGDAHVVAPLTDDTVTINNMLTALHPNIMPAPGSHTEAAIGRALQLLRDAGAPQGDLLLITDGVVSQAQRAIKDQLKDGHYRLSVLGVGGDTPAPIPGKGGSFVRDSSNNIVTTRLDGAALRSLAHDGHGRYSNLTTDNRDIDWLLGQPAPLNENLQQIEREFDSWYDRGYWLVFLLLPVVLYCFRRGVLALLIILPASLFFPAESHAFEWRNLWLTNDQQGQRALEQGDADTAAETFNDPKWKGSALYRAGDYAAAAEYFAEDDTARGHYNRGNALSKAGQLEEGISAYEQALALQPDFPEAKANLELVKQLLEQQQNQEQQNQEQQDSSGEDGENQDQQDQESSQDQDSQDGEPQDQDNASDQNNAGQDSEDSSGSDSKQPTDQQSAAGNPEDNEQDSPSSDASQENEQADNEQSDEAEPAAQEENAQAQSEDSTEEGESGQEQPVGVEEGELSEEQQRALEQWLRRVPDDPSGLLRNKFRYQYEQQRQQRFSSPWPQQDNRDRERW